jgi:hypothetical protein
MRRACLIIALVAGGASALPGCERSTPARPGDVVATGDGAAGPPWFEECAAPRGLVFRHESGHGDAFLMPEIMAGGAALVDVDGDGDLDAYLVQSGRIVDPPDRRPPNRLFRNDGAGRFEDVTDASGADDRGYGMGVATGDYDNDGDVDLYVTNVGPNTLLRNDGAGRFENVTAVAGVGDDGFGASATFLDYDGDGDLDLVTVNYLAWSRETELVCYNKMGAPDYCDPQNYAAPARDVLYRNDGDGTFTDVTEAAGLGRSIGTGLGVIAADFDGDGRVDVFVANDGMRDHLWMNRGDGTFVDEALYSGCAVDVEGQATASVGGTGADIDDAGDPDLLVCNLGGESDSLFRNEGGHFADVTVVAGLGSASRPLTRFGMAWMDFDNDGMLDLYQANGRVMMQSDSFRDDDPYAEPNLLFRGTGPGRFEEVRPRGGTATTLVATSRGAAFGDVDGDGGVDVLVVNRDAPAHLLRNVAPDRGAWLGLRVVDERGRDAIGATVSLLRGDRRVTRTVRTGYSYCAANDARVHVGLGAAAAAADVVVRWPDGTEESFGDLDAGGVVTLARGAGTPR